MKTRVSLFRLFWVFFKLGALTFGGGYAMVAIMERELVKKEGWFTEEDFLNLLSASQMVPGVLSVNTAAFSGSFLRGWKGSLISCLGVILPSFIIISVIALFFENLQSLPQVHSIFVAVRACTAVIIFFAAFRLARKTLKSPFAWTLGGLSLVLLLVQVSPLWILLGGLVLGLVRSFFLKPVAVSEETAQDLEDEV